ncbi:hypothetical protein [Paenibacillus peoriae]|uniref:hypothetical protein n=1 Tax=Paenibacillus peoriae TaxID=59893 RepID=UPI00096CD506|nr:hypothetical protein [Paenibacillus peoriae]OMF50896.1 hypothetical protein BK135_01135 [Paenibacillus peoriae]
MEEQQLEPSDIIKTGLKYIDDAITEDSNTKLFLWNTIEKVLNRPNDNYKSLADIIDIIFHPPAGRAIELLLSSELGDDVSSFLLKNKSFYISLNQSFGFDYHTSIMSYNNSPLSLVKLELLSGNTNIVRILRADKSYLDLDLDSVGIAYFVEFMFNLMNSSFVNVDEDYRRDFLNFMKGRVESAQSINHE